MQAHSFSIEDALLFPFQMLIKRPLLFFMMLVIAIAIQFIYHNIFIYQIQAFVFRYCETEYAIENMLKKLFPLFLLLEMLQASIIGCLLTAISTSFYRTGTAPFKTIIASLKYIPLYALLIFIFNTLIPYAVKSLINIEHTPENNTRFLILIVTIIITMLLPRFTLSSFFLIDKKAGLKSVIASFQATRNNYLKIIVLILVVLGIHTIKHLLNTQLVNALSASKFNLMTVALMILVQMVIESIALVYSTCGFAYAYGKLSE